MAGCRKQKAIWENEHEENKVLPTETKKHSTDVPSRNVQFFLRFIKTLHLKQSFKVIDIGCGKGRNSIFLAKLGFNVHAIDYVRVAINHLKKKTKELKLNRKIHATTGEIDEKWPYKNNFFDLAIDNFSSIDIETKEGRETYKKELLRTLKPGGYALVSVVSADDKIEREQITKSPGHEKNSTYWVENGKFQKDYDEKELRGFYREFEIVKLKKIKKKSFKLGRHYNATNFLLILKKN